MDHESFDVLGKWELDRGPQKLAYDFWWHLGFDTLITSEWGTPNMVKKGVNPEILLGGGYGHKLHIWDLPKRRHLQELDLGLRDQMALELRPAHDPTRAYGFLGVVVSLKDLSASIWLWHRDNGKWGIQKVIEIPAEPADPATLPPLLQGFKAVPPLITDINLSLDDRFLYVSCFGTGEFLQYDVSDPFQPAKDRIGAPGWNRPQGCSSKNPKTPLNGAPQMVELSRDGKRIYFTNSLYTPWDAQFYPEGIQSWMVKLDAKPEGGMEIDPKFFVEFDARSPGPSGRRRRFFRLVLLRMSGRNGSLVHALLAGGLSRHQSRNGMVVRGGSRHARASARAVWGAMIPLGVGHALAVATALLVALAAETVVPGHVRPMARRAPAGQPWASPDWSATGTPAGPRCGSI